MERDVGRHPGVAVAVGADPRPEPEQHGRGRRAGPGPAGVDGERLTGGGGGRTAAARVDRPVERPHVARHDHEQRLVEDRERRADLVQRRRRHGPQVARVPQQRDLLAQAPAQVRVLVGRGQRVVERVEQPADPPQGDEQRPTPGLRRVGGEHRVHRDAAQERLDAGPVVVHRQPLDRLAQRFVDRPSLRPARPRPQHADPLALLGEVDELEVEGERAGDRRRAGHVERRDLRPEPLPLDVGLEDHVRVAAAERDRAAPDAFHEREQVRSSLLGDDLAQERSEEPDLVRQRVAGMAQPGALRLRGDGREPGSARA